jgi:predicted  nucleic acid-binding Zn-ribbon protein
MAFLLKCLECGEIWHPEDLEETGDCLHCHNNTFELWIDDDKEEW